MHAYLVGMAGSLSDNLKNCTPWKFPTIISVPSSCSPVFQYKSSHFFTCIFFQYFSVFYKELHIWCMYQILPVFSIFKFYLYSKIKILTSPYILGVIVILLLLFHHIHSIYIRYGPLSRVWCMRFDSEAKHSYVFQTSCITSYIINMSIKACMLYWWKGGGGSWAPQASPTLYPSLLNYVAETCPTHFFICLRLGRRVITVSPLWWLCWEGQSV